MTDRFYNLQKLVTHFPDSNSRGGDGKPEDQAFDRLPVLYFKMIVLCPDSNSRGRLGRGLMKGS